MLPRIFLVLWVPLVVLACFAFSSGRADAEEALASWYGPGFSGLPTASGELYDPFGFTAAHKTMPLGTELLVSYGGSSVNVTVTDRGPYVGARELDLSQGAAEFLGLTEAGVDYVEYASTGQYADASQYASTSQYDPSAVEPVQGASADQYSTGGTTVFADQYAVTGQYAETGAVLPPEEISTPEPVQTAYASEDRGSVLVVRPGETLSEIAVETGVSVDYLASQNAVADPNLIYPGQVLYY